MTDTAKAPERPTAHWTIELNTTCPACEKEVDLLDDPDFWGGRLLGVGEDRKQVSVTCPDCGAEFEVDCVY